MKVGDTDWTPADFGYIFCPVCGRRINILREPQVGTEGE